VGQKAKATKGQKKQETPGTSSDEEVRLPSGPEKGRPNRRSEGKVRRVFLLEPRQNTRTRRWARSDAHAPIPDQLKPGDGGRKAENPVWVLPEGGGECGVPEWSRTIGPRAAGEKPPGGPGQGGDREREYGGTLLDHWGNRERVHRLLDPFSRPGQPKRFAQSRVDLVTRGKGGTEPRVLKW